MRVCAPGCGRAGAPGVGVGWGGGGRGVCAGDGRGRGRREGSPSPAARGGTLPSHVRARSGADVFCLGERELSRRALPLAGAANLPSRTRGGAVTDGRREQPLRGRDCPGRRASCAQLPMAEERAGLRVSRLADGSVLFFFFFSSFATGIKRQGEEEREGKRG